MKAKIVYDKQSIELKKNRMPIVDECNGCGNIDGEFCNCYMSPEAKWRHGNCVRATEFRLKTEEEENTFKLKRKFGR